MQLQVLICTSGHERIATMATPPALPDVSYLISWQVGPGQSPQLPTHLQRPDISFVVTNSRGLANNRNHALEHATGDVVLLADDDLIFDADALAQVCQCYERHPEIDFAVFRHNPPTHTTPDSEYDMSRSLRKRHQVVSFDISFLRQAVVERQGHRFNAHFGAGLFDYCSAEEGLFVLGLQRDKTLRGRYFPIALCQHIGDTTGERLARDPRVLHSEGAYIARKHRLTGLPRLFLRAYRLSNQNPFPLFHHMLVGWARATFRPKSLGF